MSICIYALHHPLINQFKKNQAPSLQILGADFAKCRCRSQQVPNLLFQLVPILTGAELSCTRVLLCHYIHLKSIDTVT